MNQHLELADFRRLAFNGNFREMVEASALSSAMIIYLDTIYSVAGAPNENYPRELMELHTMGVDGGYTQSDVEELSRVITGWTLCKKANADINDPLAPCIPEYWDDAVPGRIVRRRSRLRPRRAPGPRRWPHLPARAGAAPVPHLHRR